jgi:hypothetical protein
MTPEQQRLAEQDRAIRLSQPRQTKEEALVQLRRITSAPDDYGGEDTSIKQSTENPYLNALKFASTNSESKPSNKFSINPIINAMDWIKFTTQDLLDATARHLKQSATYKWFAVFLALVFLGILAVSALADHRYFSAGWSKMDMGDTPQAGRFFFHVENGTSGIAIYRMNTITGKIDLIAVSSGEVTTVKLMEPSEKTEYNVTLTPAKK